MDRRIVRKRLKNKFGEDIYRVNLELNSEDYEKLEQIAKGKHLTSRVAAIRELIREAKVNNG